MRLYLDCFRREIAAVLDGGLRAAGWHIQTLAAGAQLDSVHITDEPSALVLDGARPAAQLGRAIRLWRAAGASHTLLCLLEAGQDPRALLAAGADDFVLPPYHPAEIDLRLRVRRAPAWLHLPPCRVDLEAAEAIWPDARHPLTATEVRLLAHFAAHCGRTLPREELLSAVWGYAPGVDTRAVALAISRLRKKIEVDPQEPTWLCTVYGVGYRLTPLAPTPALQPAVGRLPSLIGRAADVAAIEARLRQGLSLLTLHGPAGVGKTRLALEIAAREASRPVLLCELGGCTDAADALGVLAAHLGLGPTPAEQIVAAATRALVGTGALLIFDGCEAVLGVLAPALDGLAQVAGLQTLLTTRLRLGLPGATLVPVNGLAPADAAALFIERAAQARPGFAPDAAQREAIVGITTGLGGLPLAIELAASRIRVLDVRQIAAGLAHPLELLKRPTPGDAAQQTTLEQAIAGSWALLTPALRRALAALSVLRGAFDTAAACQIIGPEDAPLDALSLLMDHSLVQGPDAVSSRFQLAAAVRAFAQAHVVDTGPAARHLAHFLKVAAELAEDLHGADVLAARRRVAAVHDDLRGALLFARAHAPEAAMPLLRSICEIDWVLGGDMSALDLIQGGPQRPDTEEGARVTAFEVIFLQRLGRHAEARALLDAHLRRVSASMRPEGLGRALALQAAVALIEGQIEVAMDAGRQALETLRAVEDRETRIVVIKTLGVAHRLNGQLRQAEALLVEALCLAEAAAASWQAAIICGSLAIVRHRLGETDAALADMRATRSFFRALGAGPTEMTAQWNLAVFLLDVGQIEGAQTALAEAVALNLRFGADEGRFARHCLGAQLALEQADPPSALAELDLARRAPSGRSARWEAFAQRLRAWCLALNGEPAAALRAAREAQADAARRGNRHQLGRLLLIEGLVLAAAALHQDQAAAALHSAAAHLASSDAPDSPLLVGMGWSWLAGAPGTPPLQGLGHPCPELRWATRLPAALAPTALIQP